MKVTANVKQTTITYGLIRTGESFRRDSQGSKLFIKTDADGVSGKACVDLSSGCTYSYKDEHDGFSIVDAEVVVHG